MNLRISKGQLRFRITRDELGSLLQGDILELRLPLSTGIRCYHLRCTTLPGSLALHEAEGTLTLTVDRGTLGNFEKQLPSREGIEQEITLADEAWTLMLEVDVRRRKDSAETSLKEKL